MILIIPYLIYTYKDRIKQFFLKPKDFVFYGLDLRVFNAINEHRQSIGLNILDGALNLTEIAESHVNWMAENEISHYGFVDRQFKANAKAFAEVICTHKHTAESYLLTYLNSDKHKLAIKKTDVTHIGIYTNESGLQCILFGGY